MMKTRTFAFLFLLFASTAAAKSCAGPGNVPYDNYCSGETDPETGRDAPNCVNSGTRASPAWVCGECAVNCDCGIGEYCIKTPGPSAGKCARLSETGKIGGPCTSFALRGTPGARDPVKDVDDLGVCGISIFSDADGSFLGYEWLGGCLLGRCAECIGDTASWAIATTAQIVPGMSSFANVANLSSAWDGGSLICSERYCDAGKIVGSTSWFYEVYPTGVLTGILVFVIFIFTGIVCVGFVQYCSTKRMFRSAMEEAGKKLRRGVNSIKTGGRERVSGGGSDELDDLPKVRFFTNQAFFLTNAQARRRVQHRRRRRRRKVDVTKTIIILKIFFDERHF